MIVKGYLVHWRLIESCLYITRANLRQIIHRLDLKSIKNIFLLLPTSTLIHRSTILYMTCAKYLMILRPWIVSQQTEVSIGI